MARPQKNPSESLRVASTMSCIASEHRLPLSGYAFEKYFEPENFRSSKKSGREYRSGKWDRYIKKGVMPTGKSLICIEKKCPYAYAHYRSPLWEAIQAKNRTEYEWQQFYLQLTVQVSSEVFDFLSNKRIMDGRFKKENMPLVKLIRIGNDHAIAALIGLLQQFRKEVLCYDYIETKLYNVIFNFLSHFFPYDIVLYVYKYLYEEILSAPVVRFRESPWPDDLNTVAKIISIEHKNLLIAEELGIVSTYEQGREFYFWKMIGDRFEIVREMTNALYENEWRLTSHPKGLKWLIQKLNKTRARNRKLNTEFI